MSAADPRQLLALLFRAAVHAAHPAVCLPPYLPPPPQGRLIVVGAGKAAAAMAATVEAQWSERAGGIAGTVVVPDGYAAATCAIRVLEASHPLPDERAVAAGRRILASVSAARTRDMVLCLLSGGASAVLTLPADGVTLEDKRRITDRLLRAGAAIGEVNTVRKHLSAIKGGRLAVAAGAAPVLTLAISDVIGDDRAIIGSGPTWADPTTCQDALEVLVRYSIEIPDEIVDGLKEGRLETPNRLPPGHEYQIVARPKDALAAAADCARRHGLAVLDLGDACDGEARDVARTHANLARQIAAGAGPVAAPAVIIAGGELTVRVRGRGRGGPNTEYALALAVALAGAPGIWVLAADSDGSDGNAGAAGAFATPDTLVRAARLGADPEHALEANDSAAFFNALGDLYASGPTLTNVNDIRLMLVL
jgi:hydroxypyruvate reductase